MGAGDNPIKATGLLFAYLSGICGRTDPETPQVWKLSAVNRPANRPWDELKRAADHQHENVEDLWRENRLGEADLRSISSGKPTRQDRDYDSGVGGGVFSLSARWASSDVAGLMTSEPSGWSSVTMYQPLRPSLNSA